MDFKERFGLDYLTSSIKKAPSSSDASLPKGLNDAVVAFGRKVIDVLFTDQDQTMQLFDIAKVLSARVETLSPVMTFLTANGYVDRVVEDSLGNDTFRLTDSGRRIVSQAK